MPVCPAKHLALDCPTKVIVVWGFRCLEEASHFCEITDVHRPMETQQGGHLFLGAGLGLIASPTASCLREARLVGMLHCKPQPFSNLRCDDARHILDNCHVPLDANRSTQSIELGAPSQSGIQLVVGPPMYEGIV